MSSGRVWCGVWGKGLSVEEGVLGGLIPFTAGLGAEGLALGTSVCAEGRRTNEICEKISHVLIGLVGKNCIFMKARGGGLKK